MLKALLRVRFQALFAGMIKQTHRKGKHQAGMAVLFSLLFLYLGIVICGMMGFLFHSLAEPYHAAGLDWLYFAMAGMMGMGFAVVGSVFTTQNQLYDAKDNGLLLAMPIPPGTILLSRMIPLLAMNLLFAGIVMLPATVVWAVWIRFDFLQLLLQLVSLFAASLLAQAIACLLGWLLHLLLSRMNKSAASLLYMVVFLGLYFAFYSQAEKILGAIAVNGPAIAGALQTWVWPLYAMGRGCVGGLGYLIAFVGICAGIFALVYRLLSATFLRSATSHRSGRRRRLDIDRIRSGNAGSAIAEIELRRFLGTPVYLTNMGLGLILTIAMAVAGVLFRDTLLGGLGELAVIWKPQFSLIICAMLAFITSTVCISTPSVSLEGKNLWILKSMPVSSKEILLGKLRFHCRMAVPPVFLAGLILAAVYGCEPADTVLCGIVPALLAVINGLLGLICGLKWARLDWISEAYPCKQSVSVIVVMFSIMCVPIVLGAVYLTAAQYISVTAFLALCALVLAGACFGLFKALTTWGVQKWDSL